MTAEGVFRYELGVTNFEIQIMLKNMIWDWFNLQDNHYNDLIKALLLGDLDAVRNAIVMEFKVHKPKIEASLEETVQAVLKQI